MIDTLRERKLEGYKLLITASLLCKSWDFKEMEYHLLSTIYASLGGYQILNVHPYGCDIILYRAGNRFIGFSSLRSGRGTSTKASSRTWIMSRRSWYLEYPTQE